MEQQLWPTKFQQSGPHLERTNTDTNNGNSPDNLLHVADNSCNGESKCERNARFQQKLEDQISEESRNKINTILNEVCLLLPTEKLLLYLKLPTECKETGDPLRQPLNPLGSRSEISQTIMWIKTHLEEDPDISLQKKGVYDEYKTYCDENNIKNLSTADFGKVMKQVYPKVRPRRLGTRGNSQYCYSGLRKRLKLSAPLLPDLADKPQSTEPLLSHSDLMAAAWIIIKEWSESHLGLSFESVQALAYHLTTKCSIGIGTKAASIVTNDIEKQGKDISFTTSSSVSKHRETALQLQRKLQQKSEGCKEVKRKCQLPSPKPSRSKKYKPQQQLQQQPPSLAASPTAVSDSNQCPSQGLQSVCDKSLDFTNLQTLPDFSSFQKPAASETGSACDVAAKEEDGFRGDKIAIPRLNSKRSPVPPPRRHKNAKYKTIQPKPEPCDNAYNPQPLPTGDPRSQENEKTKPKKEETSPLLEEEHEPILSRERLISASKVSKDALDDYLGTGNSQEHEEELMKYFENNNQEAVEPDMKKLSQLRQLLQKANQQAYQNTTNTGKEVFKKFLPKIPSGSVRRRVSFDTQVHDEPVPPSPNTRRKNFSFTPISPGPQSPNGGRQSKGSSTNASPFVSPRNTPVPRARGNSHPYPNPNIPPLTLNVAAPKKIKNFKIKSEVDLMLNLDYKTNITMPMSAPPSPKPSFLQNLLNKKNVYPNNYTNLQNTSSEITQLFTNNIVEEPALETYRSQSVPLEVIPPFYSPIAYPIPPNEEPNAANAFNDLTTFSPVGNLDEAQLDELMDFENELNPVAPENFQEFPKQSNIRWPNRSQSFNLNPISIQNVTKCPAYRSVPNTPVESEKIFNQNSRSHPSTPLTNETFNYNQGHDYLLNGQPIKEKLPPALDTVGEIDFLVAPNKDNMLYGNMMYDPNLNSDNLMDNKSNYNFGTQMEVGFCAKNIDLEENCEIMTSEYFKNVPDANRS